MPHPTHHNTVKACFLTNAMVGTANKVNLCNQIGESIKDCNSSWANGFRIGYYGNEDTASGCIRYMKSIIFDNYEGVERVIGTELVNKIKNYKL